MQFVIDDELSFGPRLAVDKLNRILNSRAEWGLELDAPDEEPSFLIGLADRSDVVGKALATAGLRCPSAPESVLLHPLPSNRFIIAGSDERGLIYALLEAARAVEVAPADEGASFRRGLSPRAILDSIPTEIGSPHLSWRSMQLFLCNPELEREWVCNDRFWEEYLDQLALCRYNNLSLTFGRQIAYMSPPYPFLLDLPEFPQVRTPDFSPEQRRQRLEMLMLVSAYAQLRGLHFTMGVWSQHAHGFGEPMVEGLGAEILAGVLYWP